jgi:hypothetical protein
MVVKRSRAPARPEIADVAVPEADGVLRQVSPQPGIDARAGRAAAVTEKGVQFLEGAVEKQGPLEFKQRVLAEIDIHAVHPGRVVQQVIQGIVPG